MSHGGGTRPARSTTVVFVSSPTRCSAPGWGTCAGGGGRCPTTGPAAPIWPSCRICTPTISTSGRLPLLPRHVPVVVPSGALRAVPGLRRLRDRELVEVAPGDTVRVGEVVVEVVPAEHDGRRWPWSRRRAPALGYVVSGEARTYFAGDTDWSAVVREAVGRCDIALLPVGGWGPTLGLRAPRCGPRRRLPGRARRPPRRSRALRHDVAGRPRTGPPGPVPPPRNRVRRARRPAAASPARCASCSPGRRRGSTCPITRRGDGEPGAGEDVDETGQ